MSLTSAAGIGTGPDEKRIPLTPFTGLSITITGRLNEHGTKHFESLFRLCKCDSYWKFHSKDCKAFPGKLMLMTQHEEAAAKFMEAVGLTPTPDAIDQLVEVFVPCLEIMTRRGWNPNGKTWRRAGMLGILCDVRKKFERLWERGWVNGKRHPDSGYDLINFTGMYLRADDSDWGEWGDPGARSDTHED